jgi:hypothetical protein
METVAEKTTEELIKEFRSLNDALDWRKEQLPEYPTAPKKPSQPKYNATSEEFMQYATDLKTYEEDMVVFRQERDKYRELECDADEVVQKFMWSFSGLDSIVPEKYRSKVWSLAYENGHSGGYHDVMGQLNDLVDIFDETTKY